MLIIVGKKNFERAVARLHAELAENVEKELHGIRSVSDLSKRVRELQDTINTLEVEKSKREESYARREREVEHKVGLERKRQEFELESGKKEATLSVREENLTADRKRFEEQMKFQEERFTKEVGYLKDMLAEIVKRLPSAEFTADLAVTPKARR